MGCDNVLLRLAGDGLLEARTVGQRPADFDRLFNEMPARIVKSHWMAIPYAQIARAQIQLTAGNHNEALDTVRQALAIAARRSFRLEEVAAYRVLGQVHEAMGDRVEADAAFHRSLEVLDTIQCPPSLPNAIGLRPLPTRRQFARRPEVDRARPPPLRGDEGHGMDRGDARRLGGGITTVIGQSDAMQAPPSVRLEGAQAVWCLELDLDVDLGNVKMAQNFVALRDQLHKVLVTVKPNSGEGLSLSHAAGIVPLCRMSCRPSRRG